MTIQDFVKDVINEVNLYNQRCLPGNELTPSEAIDLVITYIQKNKQTMSEVKTLQLQELVTACHGVAPLPPEKQVVWNYMGQAKLAMDLALQNCALEIQTHLAKYDTMDQAALDKGIAAYKETYKKMVAIRQGYTGFLDAAKDMCMGWERTWDPKTCEVYKNAVTRELELREAATKLLNAQNDKTTESQLFRQFIVNEYADMLQGYKTELLKLIVQAYTACLEQKTPEANTPTAMNAAYAAMRDVIPRPMGRYERKHVTDAEAVKLYESVPPPNWQNAFNDAIEYMKAKFKLYANDLANADKALETVKDMFAQQTAQSQQNHEAAQAANTLLAQATLPVVTPAGFKPIVETTVIEIPTVLDWEWETRIIAAFLANAQACKGKVKTKKGGALTTAQMAAALDAAGVLVEGIKYADLKK